MTAIDKDAVTSTRIGSLMDSGAVEAPESNAEATEVSGVPEGTDTVDRAAYDALAAEFEGYRAHMLAVAERYTRRHGWCAEVRNAIAEIDPVAKLPTHSATGEITITMKVEIEKSTEPVTGAMVWNAFSSLIAEVAYRRGDVSRVNAAQYGTITGAGSLTLTQTGQVGLAPYVSPEKWKAAQEQREREERERRQVEGYYGTCFKCGGNLNHHHDCIDQACGEYVNPDRYN